MDERTVREIIADLMETGSERLNVLSIRCKIISRSNGGTMNYKATCIDSVYLKL